MFGSNHPHHGMTMRSAQPSLFGWLGAFTVAAERPGSPVLRRPRTTLPCSDYCTERRLHARLSLPG
jgi:hypothetical protein